MKNYVGQLISSNTQPGYHIVILHIIQIELKYLHYLSLSFYKNRNNYQLFKKRRLTEFQLISWIWIGSGLEHPVSVSILFEQRMAAQETEYLNIVLDDLWIGWLI